MAKKKTTKKALKKTTKKSVRVKTTQKVTKKAAKKTVKKTVKKTAKKTVKKATAPAPQKVAKKASSGPKVGGRVPSLFLSGIGGRNLDLRGAPGKKIVLYFYPKDDTPGCTLEGQDFARMYGQFQAAGAEIYGISRDSLASHDKFCNKMGFPFSLLSDSDEKACAAFDVIKDKNMYGKKVRGIERSTFVIDRDGVLRHEWRKVQVDGHAQAVLEVIKALD
jgi:peroxiredoxin